MVSLLWARWSARNKAIAGERMSSVEEIVHRTMLFSSELPKQMAHVIPNCRDDKRWVPPPCNVLKINFDGAFRQQEKKWGVGFSDKRQ